MKGYIYTLEMFIAISLIFGSVIFVFSSPADKPEAELNVIQQSCWEALKYMDEKGDLRKFANQSNESAIESSLEQIISKSIGFEAKICRPSCSTSGVPANQTIIAIDYYLAGYRNIYNASKVRIYAWKIQ